MEKLREAIKAKHKERVGGYYTQLLLSGNISKEMYGEILFNHMLAYGELEKKAKELGVLDGIEGICRHLSIIQDYRSLNIKRAVLLAPATIKYIEYVMDLTEPKDVLAHMYVRHLNLIQGGAQMRKVIPFSNNFYSFENSDALKATFISKLDDTMIDEATKAFDMIAEMFDQLEKLNSTAVK